jgi:hypothetical protein
MLNVNKNPIWKIFMEDMNMTKAVPEVPTHDYEMKDWHVHRTF